MQPGNIIVRRGTAYGKLHPDVEGGKLSSSNKDGYPPCELASSVLRFSVNLADVPSGTFEPDPNTAGALAHRFTSEEAFLDVFSPDTQRLGVYHAPTAVTLRLDVERGQSSFSFCLNEGEIVELHPPHREDLSVAQLEALES